MLFLYTVNSSGWDFACILWDDYVEMEFIRALINDLMVIEHKLFANFALQA